MFHGMAWALLFDGILLFSFYISGQGWDMVSSVLEQYTIADFLEWDRNKKIVINRQFQRKGKVWSDSASSYLIDTILRDLPMPKIFIRSIIDVKTKTSIREVVDGQQRISAILRFADDRLRLSSRAKEFEGLTYSTLSDELKQRFLNYSISVDQLINATDQDILSIFARLNSYNVKLNPVELRHAEYQGEFKWAVHESAEHWKALWDDLKLLSVSQRVRMYDDSYMAEFYGIFLTGLTDGGQTRITALYKKFDDEMTKADASEITQKVDRTLGYLVGELRSGLVGRIASPPHFLILFAAVAHSLFGIPKGGLDELPKRTGHELEVPDITGDNLKFLEKIIVGPPPTDRYFDFWFASLQTTQRIASRKTRFPFYCEALLPVKMH